MEDPFLCEVVRFKYPSCRAVDFEPASFGNCRKGNTGCKGKRSYLDSRATCFT